MKTKIVSLRKNNFHIYLICTVVLVTTVFAFFISAEVIAWSNLRKYADTELALYSSTLDEEMNLKESKVQALYWSNSFGTLLNSNISEPQKFDIQYNYVEIFNQLISLDNSITGILLYYEKPEQFRGCYSAHLPFDLITAAKQAAGEMNKSLQFSSDSNQASSIVSGYWGGFIYQNNPYLIYRFGTVKTCIDIILDVSTVMARFNSSSDRLAYSMNDTFCLDENLSIDSSMLEKSINTVSTDHQNNIIIRGAEIAGTSLSLFLIVPMSRMHHWDLISMYITLIILIFIILILSIHLQTVSVVESVESMTERMNRIAHGEFDLKMKNDRNILEFNQMSDAFNEMLNSMKSYRDSYFHEKMERNRTLTQYLQLQIRPHFYMNCLTTIYALAQQKKYKKMNDMILTTSDYMRYSLNDTLESVPLSSELKFAEDCVKIRREGRAGGAYIVADIESGLEATPIPPFTIQTFVENSLKYAICNPLIIYVRVHKEGNEDGMFLDISIHDNGQGYPNEMLEAMASETVQDHKNHIGIYNLQRRLELTYHGKAGTLLQNDQGAVSEILIPITAPEPC